MHITQTLHTRLGREVLAMQAHLEHLLQLFLGHLQPNKWLLLLDGLVENGAQFCKISWSDLPAHIKKKWCMMPKKGHMTTNQGSPQTTSCVGRAIHYVSS